LATAVILSVPSLIGIITVKRWWRGMLLIGVTLALGATGWLARTWVPPATLWLTEVAVSQEFNDRNRSPGAGIKQLGVTQLRAQGLFAYTAISAPRGLNERIYHVWRHNGEEVERIALDISGGRKEGYRAWTHKQNFPSDALGHWQIQVLTEAGQMIGVLRFRVLESAAAPSPDMSGAAETPPQPKNQ
jgi:hypothetical protein